jgi:hypothetical protein
MCTSSVWLHNATLGKVIITELKPDYVSGNMKDGTEHQY